MIARYRVIGWCLVLGAGVLATVPAQGADADGDGVDDALDVCSNTPVGVMVDAQGRPLGDFDSDCDADAADFALFAACLNGPNIAPPAECSVDADFDNDGDVDAADYALFQNRFTGTLPPPGMALIPAGQFQMGDAFDERSSDELPVHAVYVDAFYMDAHEVTNQEYADALNWAWSQNNLIIVTSGVVYKYNTGTGYCDTTTSSSYSRITWNGSTFGVVAGKEHHPVVMVSWYGAVAYANWRSAMEGKPLCYDLSTWTCNFGGGYRLPTEAEWEKAARGGAVGHRFPWSDTDTIQHSQGNYYSYWKDGSPFYDYDTSPTRGYHADFDSDGFPYTSPVGYFAPNGYGLYDMAGNVYEWCNDWYGSSYYSTTPYPHVNPHGPASGTHRVLRGGSWGAYAVSCRVAYRFTRIMPDTRYHYAGFRLALNVE